VTKTAEVPKSCEGFGSPAAYQKTLIMKKTKSIATLALVTLTALITGCTASSPNDHSAQEHSGAKTIKYTCSMHPEIVQDNPGDCPKCGMKLVEKQ
jgi:hypothetical protein